MSNSPNVSVHNYYSRSGITVRSLNIRSLFNKVSMIEADIDDQPDIIAIQETWLNDSHADDLLYIPGYSIARCDRPGRGGGGVAFYISDRVGWSIPNLAKNDHIEYLCIDVRLGRSTIRVCNVYRPDSPVEWLNHFTNVLDIVSNTRHDFILVGDFNIDFLDHVACRALKTILQSYDLTQHCDHPTRITNNSSTCIDLLITRNTNRYPLKSLGILDPSSDHCQITATFGVAPKQKCIEKVKWLYTSCEFNALNSTIRNHDWNFLSDQSLNINDKCKTFMNNFETILAAHIPTQKYFLRPNDKVWMTSDVRKEQRKKIRLHRKAKIQDTPEAWARYRSQRNHVTSIVRKAKQDHNQSIIDKLNELDHSNADWWKVVRTAFGCSRNHIPALESADQSGTFFVTDDKSKANLLNDQFVKVTDVGDENRVFPEQFPRAEARLDTIEITAADVVEAINSIQCSKAPGPDSITPFILKNIASSISKPLSLLFNFSLSSSKFPDLLKSSTVIPIFKKGVRSDPKNYRPISLTSIISKVFEKAVLKYLLPYLLTNNLITDKQAGFLPKHSTSHQLVEICDSISSNLKHGLATTIVFADISRAFDRLSHRGIYCKLTQYGFSPSIRDWIHSFLTGRQQRTLVGGEYSTWKTLKGGVAQGSVLGPVIFLLMINDLPDALFNNTHLFADDTSVLFSHSPRSDITTTINEELERLERWADTWMLDLNPSKTKFMVISTSRDVVIPTPTARGQPIEYTSSHKHLGVTFNDRYTWTDHVHQITDQVSSRIGVLRSLRFKLSRTCLRTIYISHIRSKLEYCDVVWDGLCDGALSMELEKLQRDCIRIFTGLTAYCSVENLYRESGLDTLKERRRQHRLTLLFKIIHDDLPTNLKSLLPRIMNDDNARSGRHKMVFYLGNNPKIEKYKRSFFYLTCNEWNYLDADIRTTECLATFKRVIRGPQTTVPILVELPRYTSILYNRLKYGCSALHYDLRKSNLIPDSMCECNLAPETLFHYLYDCPFYDIPRANLMFELNELGLASLSIEVLFNYDIHFNSETIRNVQLAVFRYINATRRFS